MTHTTTGAEQPRMTDGERDARILFLEDQVDYLDGRCNSQAQLILRLTQLTAGLLGISEAQWEQICAAAERDLEKQD